MGPGCEHLGMKDAPRPWEEIPEVGGEFLTPRLDPGSFSSDGEVRWRRGARVQQWARGKPVYQQKQGPSHHEVQPWLLPLKGGVEGK